MKKFLVALALLSMTTFTLAGCLPAAEEEAMEEGEEMEEVVEPEDPAAEEDAVMEDDTMEEAAE